MASAEPGHELIVVGVDGSKASKAALNWAARHGRHAGATVRATMAWHIEPGAVSKSDESSEQEARAGLDEVIAEVQRSQPEFSVEAQLQRGEPTAVLLDQAQDADLLVFGDKGRGPVVGMLVGSVVTQFLRHAPCPLVIVGQQMAHR